MMTISYFCFEAIFQILSFFLLSGTLDVHGEKSADYLYALMFTVSDENLSWYLDENIKTHCSATAKVNKEDEDFQESNKMHCE